MRSIAAAIYLLFLLLGCSAPTHLVYYHRSVVGFDASASTETRSGQMTFGYDRRLVAVVPKTNLSANGTAKKFEAMSVMSCTEVNAGYLSLVEFDERLATGDAATSYAAEFARNPQTSAFKCFRPDQ
jgi:hypothetical protein